METYFWTSWMLLHHTQNQLLPQSAEWSGSTHHEFISLHKNVWVRVTVYSLKVTAFHVIAFDLRRWLFMGLHAGPADCMAWDSGSTVSLDFFFCHGNVAFLKETQGKRWVMITAKRIHFSFFKRGSISWWPQCGVSVLRGGTEWQAVLILRTLFVFFIHCHVPKIHFLQVA